MNMDFSNLKVALCISKFGFKQANIDKYYVPGALELPLLLSRCCKSKKFDALIAIGAVIRGETYHFEVVSDQSAMGIMNVQLQYDIPIMNAVLTTNNDDETIHRTSTKGIEVVNGLIETLNTLNSIT
jgi:6,7-dimethyl-8-ribityllumazine synthase